MPTQRIALLCVAASCFLFSCNNKKSNSNNAGSPQAINRFDTVKVLPDEALDLKALNTGFIDGVTQRFTTTTRKISVIIAKRGLRITLDPAALEKEDGSPVSRKINVSVIELANSEDLFRSNAATLSDGRLLTSGGSYFIGMESNGEKLRIKKGKTMRVDFPVLKTGEMELFYGERNAMNDMNWKKAGKTLELPIENISFTDNNRNADNTNSMPGRFFMMNEEQYYVSLKDEVYYYNKKMTLGQLVDTLNLGGARVYVDSVYAWPRATVVQDTNFLLRQYGPRYQLHLRMWRPAEAEKEAIAKKEAIQKALMQKWQPGSLAGQLQKYYAPSLMRSLGWINCDRFYNIEQTDIDLDIPISLNNSRMEYFVIFRSFSGLVNSRVDLTADAKVVIKGLPIGEPVTLVAFAKHNGIIYQGKEEFVIEKNKKVAVDFKTISREELSKIFGNNIKA